MFFAAVDRAARLPGFAPRQQQAAVRTPHEFLACLWLRRLIASGSAAQCAPHEPDADDYEQDQDQDFPHG
jgi:hypothetical protein